MPFSPESDEALVMRLLSRPEEDSVDCAERDAVWAEVHEHCRAQLWRYIRQWISSEEEAEEIYQDTLITAYFNVENGRYTYEGKPFVAYLKAIARYKIFAERRRTGRWVELDDDLLTPGGDDGQRPERVIESLQEWEMVMEAIDELPHKQRRIMVGIAAGKHNWELAEEYDMTEEAVRQHKSRGIRTVQERVA